MIPPPIHPDDLDLDAPPGCILLDPYGYISDRTNATTAVFVTKGGKSIKVTFWAVHRPHVSYFTVHCPDVKPSAFGGLPLILNIEDDLVLLRVPLCTEEGCIMPCTWDRLHFVYHPGTESKPPSLDLIPSPPDDLNLDWAFGLLRCRGRDMYFVAMLSWLCRAGQYELHIYNSDTETWSTRSIYSQQKFKYTYASKVITIGGEHGSMGWVDLLGGILICDVLVDNHQARHIQLPSPMVSRKLRPAPIYYSDVIFVGGYIKYFEMTLVANGWEAVKWRRKVSWRKWKKDCVLKVSEDPTQTQLLSDLQEAETKKQLAFTGDIAGYPALSFQDDDVVYITDKYDPKDRRALVLAVDLRKQTLRDVADHHPGRSLGHTCMYLETGISKHLRRMPPTRGKSEETNQNEIVQAVKYDVPGKGLQSLPSSKVDGTNRKFHGRRRRR